MGTLFPVKGQEGLSHSRGLREAMCVYEWWRLGFFLLLIRLQSESLAARTGY